MNSKKLVVFCALIATEYSGYAQYAADALRFSEFEQGSSSRFKGLGNAQTALGGDISSISGNPAGLGMFTKSEFAFSADYSSSNVNSNYINQTSEAQKDKLGFNQLGAVFYTRAARAKGSDLKTGWLSFNFGIGYNKTNNFNTTIDYSGTNPNSSYADYLADLANDYLSAGNPSNTNNQDALPEGTLPRMGYDALLIEYNAAGYFPATEVNNNQRNLAYRTGFQSEVNFAVGANYSNELYLGASIGLSSLDYDVDRELIEKGDNRNFPGQLPELIGGTYTSTYQSYQSTEGSGINGKIGFIYRPTNILRIGANFITPTWYTIKDDFSEVLNANYRRANGSAVSYGTNGEELYQSDYNLRTPYKLNAGAAVIINKQGLISGDVEFVDYSSIHFSSDDGIVERSNNNEIRDSYKGAVNFRIGGEYKIANLMLRAGYNTTGSPYKNLDFSSETISGGVGYRKKNMYIDLTYQNFSRNSENTPYVISENYPDFSTTGNGETASLKNTRNSVFLTIGTRF